MYLPAKDPVAAASKVETLKRRKASSTCVSVTNGCNCIFAKDSDTRMMASSCLQQQFNHLPNNYFLYRCSHNFLPHTEDKYVKLTRIHEEHNKDFFKSLFKMCFYSWLIFKLFTPNFNDLRESNEKFNTNTTLDSYYLPDSNRYSESFSSFFFMSFSAHVDVISF